VKNGHQKDGTQRYYCKKCRVSFQDQYINKACEQDTNYWIQTLIIEGCGTSSIARLLKISPTTVTRRILAIANMIRRPAIVTERTYEMDELVTYIGRKKTRIYIAYAIDRKTREVVDYIVGRRNKRILGFVVNTLILSGALEIRTDKCVIYPEIIPKEIHHVKNRGINYIERKNLTLRTHLKRLNRRTIAYSKSLLVLSAILKIYFWG